MNVLYVMLFLVLTKLSGCIALPHPVTYIKLEYPGGTYSSGICNEIDNEIKIPFHGITVTERITGSILTPNRCYILRNQIF